RPLPPRPWPALPSHRRGREGPRAPDHGRDDVSEHGHGLLAGEGGSGAGAAPCQVTLDGVGPTLISLKEARTRDLSQESEETIAGQARDPRDAGLQPYPSRRWAAARKFTPVQKISRPVLNPAYRRPLAPTLLLGRIRGAGNIQLRSVHSRRP